MTNTQTIKNIASINEIERKALTVACQFHAEAQCNGDYYENDNGDFVTNNHGNTKEMQSVVGEKNENTIIKTIKAMCQTNEIPDFITYSGDCRGLVLKILSNKLTPDEITLCHDIGFIMDWGHDFGFTISK